MYALPLIASMAACLLGGIIRKHLNDKYDDSLPARQLYNAITCLVAAICLLLVGGIPQASPFTVLLALAFGLVTAVQQITTLQALTYGPYSYTSVICSLSTIIPALSGALLWGEPLGLSHVIGLLLMAVVGICVAVNNKLNLFLSGVMDSAVFFPLVNGGGLVLTALAAVLLFRERLSRKQWVGVLVGIVAVIFLCNPFKF